MEDLPDLTLVPSVLINKFLCVALVVALTGCGSITYTPSEYVITNERIQSFKVSGSVTVENLQDDKGSKVVLNAPARTWVSDYVTITEALAEQLRQELAKHGAVTGGDAKRIGVRVTDQRAYLHMFHMTGTLQVQVTLGDSAPFPINIEQGSPGNVWRVLNGNIALGVIEILSDQRVLAYLAQ
jgi:hypothetical protein